MGILGLFNNKQVKEERKQIVLVVDDDALFRQIYHDALAKENFDIITASNGQEALDAVKQKKPHAILLDITMPVMDGMEVLRQLWESNLTNEIAVIVLTNAGDVKNMEKARSYASYKFFVKANVTPPEIIAAIKEGIHVTQPYG